MVRRYLPIAVATLVAGAILFIGSRLLASSTSLIQSIVIPPMLTFEIEILGPMTVMAWIVLAVGVVLTAVMVRRSLLVGFAALCLGAVFLIEMFVIAPTTWSETQAWAGLGQLGFFSLLPAGLILMA